jgi:hypothetical protein
MTAFSSFLSEILLVFIRVYTTFVWIDFGARGGMVCI